MADLDPISPANAPLPARTSSAARIALYAAAFGIAGILAGATGLLVGLPVISHTAFGRAVLSSVARVSVGPAIPNLKFNPAILPMGFADPTTGGASGSGAPGSSNATNYGDYANSLNTVPGQSSNTAVAGTVGAGGTSPVAITSFVPAGVVVYGDRVSAGFAAALDNATSTFIAFENDDLTRLVPLLNTIYQRASVGDYTDIVAKMQEARNIIAEERGMVTDFTVALSVLSSAGATAPAAVVEATAAFTGAGNNLAAASSAYLNTIESALSGSLPTQAILDDISAKVAALSRANDDFKHTLGTLVLALAALPPTH